MVLPYINMYLPQVYTCSPSLLPSHTIPLGHPSAPAPSIQYHALNLDWQFVSYIILYVFQSHSPKSSHTLHFPQSPKDYSIHLCLFCCLRVNDNRVIITIERVTGICVSILYWCFPFWLTSLCIIGSSFIHLIRTDSNVFFKKWSQDRVTKRKVKITPNLTSRKATVSFGCILLDFFFLHMCNFL